MRGTPSRKARSRRQSWLLVLAVLIAGGVALYFWNAWSDSRDAQPEYIVSTVVRTDFEDLVSATGSLQPRDYVDVGVQVSGQLHKLLVEVGDEVKEGQLLAEIDAEQSVARVEASRASFRGQQAQLKQVQANLRKAERDLLRLQNLWKEKATTLEQVENAETLVETTRAQLEIQEARLEELEASLKVDESTLKYTKIYAPMAGTVVSLSARQGQTLNANQSAPTILRIADLSVMSIHTEVSEADVSRLKPGMPVYFTTLGNQNRRWYGKLDKIEPTPTVTNNVVLYNALFEVDNSNGNLMAQMTAQVFFVVAEAKDTLVIPMSALSFERPAGGRPAQQSGPGGPARGSAGPDAPRERRATVKVAAGDGYVEREVVVGVSSRVRAQILSGLEEGERVVIGSQQADTSSASGPMTRGPGPRGPRR